MRGLLVQAMDKAAAQQRLVYFRESSRPIQSLALTAARPSPPVRLVTPSSQPATTAGLALSHALIASSLLACLLSTLSMMAFSISWVNFRLLSSLPTFGHCAAYPLRARVLTLPL